MSRKVEYQEWGVTRNNRKPLLQEKAVNPAQYF